MVLLNCYLASQGSRSGWTSRSGKVPVQCNAEPTSSNQHPNNCQSHIHFVFIPAQVVGYIKSFNTTTSCENSAVVADHCTLSIYPAETCCALAFFSASSKCHAALQMALTISSSAVTTAVGVIAATYIFLQALLRLTQDSREPPAVLKTVPFISPILGMGKWSKDFYSHMRCATASLPTQMRSSH